MKDLFSDFKSFNKTSNVANNVQIMPTAYGFEAPSAENRVIMNQNFEYSIHFVLSGSGYIEYEGKKTIKVKAGEIFFLLPYDKKILYHANKKDPWKYGWINFIGNVVDILAKLNVNTDKPTIKPSNKQTIKKIYYDFLTTTENHYGFSSFILSSAVYNILFQLLKNTEKAQMSKQYLTYIDIAKHYIETNYSNPDLNLKTVAEQCSLNPAYFSRVFKLNMGVNFSAYLMDFRIKKATSLIQQGLYSVKELSFMVGFSSQYYFSNQFVKIHKIRPTTYINQCKSLAKEENN